MKSYNIVRKSALLGFLLLGVSTLTSQIPSPSDSLAIKLVLFPETIDLLNKDYTTSFERFLTVEISFDTLDSQGFPGLTFLIVNPEFESRVDSIPFLPSDCAGYVVAIAEDPKMVLRVEGFRWNDIDMLFSLAQGSDNKSRGEVLKTCKIENIDLYCLYKSYKKRLLSRRRESPCSTPCPRVYTIH